MIYYLFNRKLLAKLSFCAWKVLSAYLKHFGPFDDALAAAVAQMPGGDVVHLFLCTKGNRAVARPILRQTTFCIYITIDTLGPTHHTFARE